MVGGGIGRLGTRMELGVGGVQEVSWEEGVVIGFDLVYGVYRAQSDFQIYNLEVGGDVRNFVI